MHQYLEVLLPAAIFGIFREYNIFQSCSCCQWHYNCSFASF